MQRPLAYAAVLGAFLVLLTPAHAERVRSQKTETEPQHGTKPDIRVPYTTNGNGNLGVAQGVAPRIYSAPVVNDPTAPEQRPVFNLPFYGGVMSFSGAANGAKPRDLPTPLSR